MHSHRPARPIQVIACAGSIGLLLSASMAFAQVAPGAPPGGGAPPQDSRAPPPIGDAGNDAEAPPPGSVGGVTVQATRRPLDTTAPEKTKEYNEEVAKAEAWKRYRKSRPPANASTLDQADDYPGLQSLVPH